MKTEMQDIIRDLASVDRRLDNMRYLMRFQQERRTAVIERMREALDRTRARTATLVDASRANEPGMTSSRTVRLMTLADGTHEVVHAADVALLDLGVLTGPDGATDMGCVRIEGVEVEGMGAEWWIPDVPNDNSRRGC